MVCNACSITLLCHAVFLSNFFFQFQKKDSACPTSKELNKVIVVSPRLFSLEKSTARALAVPFRVLSMS